MKEIHILVVEDEVLIAMHLKAVLETQSYQVHTQTSVEAAIDLLQKQSIALVLIDIDLKTDKNGIVLGKYLLENDTIPYIYVTSNADQQTLDEVKETRPYGYIVKPFKEIDVISTVSIVLNNYQYKEIDVQRKAEIPEDPIPYRLKKIIEYINVNIDKKLEIEALAAMTEWKRHHFTTLFKKYLYVSPYQYILTRKIEKSKVLLAETDVPINEIAFELGFKSYSNFCNAFKKNCGITAMDYRRKWKMVLSVSTEISKDNE